MSGLIVDVPSGSGSGDAQRSPQRILLACDREDRASMVRAGLPGGIEFKKVSDEAGALLPATEEFGPEVLIVCSEVPKYRTIKELEEMAQRRPVPVAMFVEADDAALAVRALQAGVSSYIVRGLSPERVMPVLLVAVARFRMIEALHKELVKSRDELAARKSIERAKGLLMERRGLSEHEAYETMRREAMAQGRTLREIADMMLSVSNIFP